MQNLLMTNGARAAVAAKSVGVAEEGCCGYRGGAAVSAALSGGGRHYLSTDNSGPTLRVFHPSALTFPLWRPRLRNWLQPCVGDALA